MSNFPIFQLSTVLAFQFSPVAKRDAGKPQKVAKHDRPNSTKEFTLPARIVRRYTTDDEDTRSTKSGYLMDAAKTYIGGTSASTCSDVDAALEHLLETVNNGEITNHEAAAEHPWWRSTCAAAATAPEIWHHKAKAPRKTRRPLLQRCGRVLCTARRIKAAASRTRL